MGRCPSANDFGRFHPWLEKIFQLSAGISLPEAGLEPSPAREAPGRKPPISGAATVFDANSSKPVAPVTIYDPLIDEYEPGREAASWRYCFRSSARAWMVSAITQSVGHRTPGRLGSSDLAASHHSPLTTHHSPQRGEAILNRLYPLDRQKVFGEGVAAAIGFDFSRGRLDVTAHPFCSGIGPGDCRITTRYDEHHFSEAFSGILHEVGHGLYEQGLDEAPTARRWARRPRWVFTNRSRGFGECRRAKPGVLDLLVSLARSIFHRGAPLTSRSTSSMPRSTA